MKIINLLPKQEQKEIRLELLANQVIRFLIVLLGGLLVLSVLGLAESTYLRSEIGGTKQDILTNQHQLNTSNNEQVKNEVSRLNNEIKQIENINKQHYYWSNGLVELGNLLTDDLQIDLLEFDRASGKVKIAGTAGQRSSIIKFWEAMHKTKYFKGIDFPLTNLERAKNAPFTYTFYVNEQQFKQDHEGTQ